MGIDFRSQGRFKWLRDNKDPTGFRRGERNPQEVEGFIPLVASHDGLLSTDFYYRDKNFGWGMYIDFKEDDVEYKLFYCHIEKPWRSLSAFWQGLTVFFKPQFVREGAIIAISGNSGFPRYSTGPHLHFELQQKINNVWVSIDPMPFLQDDNLYQMYRMTGSDWFYKGKQITAEEAKLIK